MQFDFIVACDNKGGIAKNGGIPWSGSALARADMAWFRQFTAGAAVIMGRKTWESLSMKPLSGRMNIVLGTVSGTVTIGALTRSPVVWMRSLGSALDHVSKTGRRCIVIGGADIYAEALKSPWLRHGYMTIFPEDYSCDRSMSSLGNTPWTVHGVFKGCGTTDDVIEVRKYDFTNRDERAYLNLLSEIVKMPPKPSRTGVNTRSGFARTLTFDLSDVRGPILPLLTSKYVKLKNVYTELVWIISGSTNTSYLREQGNHIWDANTTREFLDARGLTEYPVGELGPGYGSQWRNYGGDYSPTSTLPRNGVDQLQRAINLLKTDPSDRRMIVTAWNPAQEHMVALPPCHWSFQFYVEYDQMKPARLCCLLNMRSADLPLGVPYNITSYSLLTHMVAKVVGLAPGKLTVMMCDCHIYENQIEGAERQLARDIVRFPTIKFSDRVIDPTIDDFVKKYTFDDIVLGEYVHGKFINYPMAV